ncbi:helix-turn-helix domain-containing protein [Streptomyces sp. NPDC006510]|uniref:helix-turn-helix domain-containing protein n=1 Tax=Streptomyces sp. NPDC006510 TaxID=3155600 RepID=UPI0033AB6942
MRRVGGGLAAERRVFREQERLEAGRRFAAGEKPAVIAKELRVSVRSVERRRRAWREGGPRPCVPLGRRRCRGSRIPGFVVLEEKLGKGRAGHGFEDQRWTWGQFER